MEKSSRNSGGSRMKYIVIAFALVAIAMVYYFWHLSRTNTKIYHQMEILNAEKMRLSTEMDEKLRRCLKEKDELFKDQDKKGINLLQANTDIEKAKAELAQYKAEMSQTIKDNSENLKKCTDDAKASNDQCIKREDEFRAKVYQTIKSVLSSTELRKLYDSEAKIIFPLNEPPPEVQVVEAKLPAKAKENTQPKEKDVPPQDGVQPPQGGAQQPKGGALDAAGQPIKADNVTVAA